MPPGLLHIIFSALHFLLRCTFCLQISLWKQSWRDWKPLYSIGCMLFCVCTSTLDFTRFSYWIDTLVLKLREILTATVLHHPFRFDTNARLQGHGGILCIFAKEVPEGVAVAEGFLVLLLRSIKTRIVSRILKLSWKNVQGRVALTEPLTKKFLLLLQRWQVVAPLGISVFSYHSECLDWLI